MNRVPAEILKHILSYLCFEKDRLSCDLLAIGMTCTWLFNEVKQTFKKAIVQCAGQWARHRLVVIGDYFSGSDYPPHLHMTNEELLEIKKWASVGSDQDGSEDGGCSTTLYGYAEEHFDVINPHKGLVLASDAIFFEIARLQRLGALTEQTRAQMLSMACPTWYLLFPDLSNADFALCFPRRGKHIVMSEVLEAKHPSHILAMVGTLILGQLCLTDDPSGCLGGGMRCPLGGEPMEIIPHTRFQQLSQHSQKVGIGDILPGRSVRFLGHIHNEYMGQDWRAPLLVACPKCGEFLEGLKEADIPLDHFWRQPRRLKLHDINERIADGRKCPQCFKLATKSTPRFNKYKTSGIMYLPN